MKILIISVHPDDETLGCGGTILKHKMRGDDLHWLILTDAFESLGFSADYVAKRAMQIKYVAQAYGFTKTYNLGLPSTRLHAIDFNELIAAISFVVTEIQPELVYTVNRSDIHTDHQQAARAIMTCTKSFRNSFIKRVLMYECLSETEIAYPLPENVFIPNVYSDISEFLEKKIEIMKLYESEVQDNPLPRSLDNIRALALYRGATVAVRYAESLCF